MKRIQQTAPGKAGRGFTLIEIMIVVAIIAILAAIAFPNYTQHVLKTHRGLAQAEMLEMAQDLERCYTRTNNYGGCGIGNRTLDSGRYEISIATPQTNQFTLTAVPQEQGRQDSDKCGSLTLNHQGVRGVSADGMNVNECWGN